MARKHLMQYCSMQLCRIQQSLIGLIHYNVFYQHIIHHNVHVYSKCKYLAIIINILVVQKIQCISSKHKQIISNTSIFQYISHTHEPQSILCAVSFVSSILSWVFLVIGVPVLSGIMISVQSKGNNQLIADIHLYMNFIQSESMDAFKTYIAIEHTQDEYKSYRYQI